MFELVINLARLFCMIVICYNIFSLVYKFLLNSKEFIILSKKTVDHAISDNDSGYFSKENLIAFMSKYGIMYRRNDYNIEASTFIIEKILIGLIFFVIGIAIIPSDVFIKIIGSIICFILGFFAPDILAKQKNAKDNSKMQDDIVSIYETLKINAKAREYIGDTLIECQRRTVNDRLKTGLTELNNNIISKRMTLEDSVDLFNARFENDQIDNLSVIIKQSLNTGKSSDILNDLTKQIEDLNELKQNQEKMIAQRKSQLRNIAFFFGLAAMVVYVTGYQVLQALQGF